ncbi:hypothetical protein FB45DRAFT_869074 [Roridomyces roridus]|uniref:F-box domain-containing protein n=1 Tax=Roridomyces roridus TaxID=1738132 RepID=A0AAD7BNI4_9AGAR|nr:hypothetical protein FB45DRAFT_869074 [Roridomyces roridus]
MESCLDGDPDERYPAQNDGEERNLFWPRRGELEQGMSKGGSRAAASVGVAAGPRKRGLFSSLLTPIRRLPPEILSKIMIQPTLHFPTSRDVNIGPPNFMGRGTSPVAAVSFHWRATALSSPKTWATFLVNLHGNDNTLRFLELYLQRAKQCPLGISVSAPIRGSIPPGILKQIIDSSERWLEARFLLDSSQLSLFLPIRGRLQARTALDLEVYRQNENSPVHPNRPVDRTKADTRSFVFAPRLTFIKSLFASLSLCVDFSVPDMTLGGPRLLLLHVRLKLATVPVSPPADRRLQLCSDLASNHLSLPTQDGGVSDGDQPDNASQVEPQASDHNTITRPSPQSH